MQAGLLPLFPLPLVLFPRTPLPLHIFEERYREMIGEAIRDGTEFGVVLTRERAVANTGCTAAIDRVVQTYRDGRLDIMTNGRRRFEIVLLDQERSFLRGSVEYFDDDDPSEAPPELRERALESYRTLVEIGDEAPEPDLEDPQLSFQLANIVEDTDFRQLLLPLRSEQQRIAAFVDFCRDYIPQRRTIADLKRVQPMNGHSKKQIPPAGHA
jgi:Lon protease-like protein